ncbi:MAG: hypothetical protein ABIK89_25520, partial [Planctomycetota bacterium]
MATKLNCPYCGETFPYDRSLAGRSGLCSYCNKPIKVPLVEELPEELQEELRQEEAKTQEKQKRKYQRKQERYLKQIEKEEKRSRTTKSHAEWSHPFLGKTNESEFEWIPGEEIIDQLTITHRVLFVFRRGVTRVTLTNHRVLYSAMEVFSPLYWIVLALLPFVIVSYLFRIRANRSVSIPLDKVDSVEKCYKPNWFAFVLCMAIVGLVSYVAGTLATSLSNR